MDNSKISFSELQKHNLNQKKGSERMFYNSFQQEVKTIQNRFMRDFGIINHLENSTFNMKNEQMRAFIKKRTLQNCEQRSEQWYTVRKGSFGGSEIANLMGNCKKKYKTQKAFLTDKLNNMNNIQNEIIPTQNQIIMDWGTFFEPLHRNVIELLFKCQIVETSLCLGEGILKGCHQSPDGLAVVNTQIFKEFVKCNHVQNQQIFDQEYITILLEQKCPTLRKPEYGVVPDNYIGQIKLGLSIFDICDIGCYSDSVIRICNTQQMFTNTYNSNIILSKKTIDNQPIFIGFVILDEQARQSLQQPIGDISNKINDSMFAYIMKLYKEGKFQVSFDIHKFNDDIQFKNIIKNRSQELSKTNAFFCWKLIDLTFTSVERSDGFKNILSMFIQIGRNILNQSDSLLIDNQIKNIKKFTTLIQNMPMTPENLQDDWYHQNKLNLLKQFKLLINNDSFNIELSNVLIHLLQLSNDKKIIKLLHEHISHLYSQFKHDPKQIKQLLKLLYSIQFKPEIQELNILLQQFIDLETQNNQLSINSIDSSFQSIPKENTLIDNSANQVNSIEMHTNNQQQNENNYSNQEQFNDILNQSKYEESKQPITMSQSQQITNININANTEQQNDQCIQSQTNQQSDTLTNFALLTNSQQK